MLKTVSKQGVTRNLIWPIVVALFGMPLAHATKYNVSARFTDGGVQGETLFNGSFDWDGSNLTNFNGLLTQSMWSWNAATGTYDGGTGGVVGLPPVLNLGYHLATNAPDADGDILASVFLLNDTNVFFGGGYPSDNAMKYGGSMSIAGKKIWDGNTPNNNAYFTLAFNAADPTNTLTATDKIIYGDCTAYGLMGPLLTGNLCMTGIKQANPDYPLYSSDPYIGGSMGGFPVGLSIAAAVPVPAAIWLFGGALSALAGAGFRGRKRVV